MKLSVKSDYATRAVLGLARHFHTGEARKVDDLASDYDIPANFLVQILIELKAKNIVKSLRGKEGGYLLARPPGEITFGDVLRAVHGRVFDTPALADSQCPTELKESWNMVQRGADTAADAIDFQQLIERLSEREKMYYI